MYFFLILFENVPILNGNNPLTNQSKSLISLNYYVKLADALYDGAIVGQLRRLSNYTC